jgi:hypothetical protein
MFQRIQLWPRRPDAGTALESLWSSADKLLYSLRHLRYAQYGGGHGSGYQDRPPAVGHDVRRYGGGAVNHLGAVPAHFLLTGASGMSI